MSRELTHVEDGDEVLEAVEALGEPTTAEVADHARLTHIRALHVAGMLARKEKGFLVIVPARPANPRWKLPVDEDIAF